MTAANPFFRIIALALLLLPAAAPRALSTDGEQPILVEADSLEMRDADNISIYEGNVSLVQGSLKLTSERLVIHFNDENELVLIVMTGSPARFRQLDDQRREMLGEALRIRYLEADSMLELYESASFTHAGDHIESDRIHVNTRDNSIEAGGKQSDQRVKMLIQPRQDNGTTE